MCGPFLCLLHTRTRNEIKKVGTMGTRDINTHESQATSVIPMFPHPLNFVGTDWEQWEHVLDVPSTCSLCSHASTPQWEQQNPVVARLGGQCSHVPTVPTLFLIYRDERTTEITFLPLNVTRVTLHQHNRIARLCGASSWLAVCGGYRINRHQVTGQSTGGGNKGTCPAFKLEDPG